MKNKDASVVWNGVPTNPEHIKAIKDAVSCTYECYHKIEAAKGEIKDIFDAVHETTGIPKRIFNFLAKANFNGKGYETLSKNQELSDVFDIMQNS